MKRKLRSACARHLQETFGLKAFRPGQQAAANALLSGRDLLCILPTGAGKSLCWQLPAVIRDELTVVVSPLIALMRDQVKKLEALSIPAVCVDSLMSPEERKEILDRVRRRQVRIVYVSPERFGQFAFQEICVINPPWMIVVDEAHCVVQWGDEFRPAYQCLGEMIAFLPRRPVVCAMTATADKAMQKALCRNLGMKRARKIIIPIIRENLVYSVRTTLSKKLEIRRLVAGTDGRVVVFCRTRSRTEELAEMLRRDGYDAVAYHAGMERQERNTAQERFLTGEIRIMTSTSAFGMGIDIPDIRLVIHDSLPDTTTEYLQQTGRAGRDGEESKCVALIEPRDLLRYSDLARRMKNQNRSHPIRKRRAIMKMRKGTGQLLKVCLSSACIYQAAAAVMGQRAGRCGKCSACRHGRLVKKAPDPLKMNLVETRAWVFRWQRQKLSEKLNVPVKSLMSDDQILLASDLMRFETENEPVHERLRRIDEYFRSGPE